MRVFNLGICGWNIFMTLGIFFKCVFDKEAPGVAIFAILWAIANTVMLVDIARKGD